MLPTQNQAGKRSNIDATTKNPNYAANIYEEMNELMLVKVIRLVKPIDKLLGVQFIQPVKWATWLSPIVIIPKKINKLRVCVEYRKWDATKIIDTFPLHL